MKKIYKITIFLFIITLISSCNEEPDCSSEYKRDYESLESQFKNLYSSDVSGSEVSSFKNSLESFLTNHEDKKCKLDGEKVSPHNEIKSIISDIEVSKNKRLVAKVVYGDDDRVDIGDSSNTNFQNWARSTAAQISVSELDANLNILSPTHGEDLKLCSGERFFNQLSAARCSGFLVAPDLIVTAGHCVQDAADCSDNVWAFDYTENKTQFSQSDIYECAEVVKTVLNDDIALDYAVVRLNRPVTDRKFLRIRSEGVVGKGDPMVIIGNPSGLPTKIADNANVRSKNEEHYFITDVDSFGGNSGSAVFNSQTGLVEGILVRGEDDYVVVDGPDGSRCRTVNVCTQNGCLGEEATKITSITNVPLVLSSGQINSKLSSNQFSKVPGVGAFKFFKYSFSDYSIAGRKFLRVCGSHVYNTNNPSSWKKSSVGSCADSGTINYFYSQIFAN